QEHYIGVGALPSKDVMAEITYQTRKRTGRGDIAFIGEKCDTNNRFEQMGFTAGTDYGDSGNKDGVKWESKQQAWNSHYATGPEVSNDNDCESYYDDKEQKMHARLNRMEGCLFGYENISDKLPTYMQMHDLFPLSPYTSTHDEMLHNRRKGNGKSDEHIYNVFDTSNAAKWYQHEVNQKFLNAIYI
ncbi:MAG: hypothetical protein PHE78_08300, partial [Candidatus Gastranaerophilales bacterium]|nr:hypothetical protein [Candidatus Gastranaerophilales bacterium]